MRLCTFPTAGKNKNDINFMSLEAISKVRNFHRSFPMYAETPLRDLKGLADVLGLRKFMVKDESYRFGLNAFKVLGGSYAIGSYIAKQLNMDIDELPYKTMIDDSIRRRLGDLTFATTTDGNHGRGVAWTANRLKQQAVVYMPKGSSRERLENIRAENAVASITDFNYDDTVRMTQEQARKNGWIIIQDTSWEGYQDIPSWIIQGYGTMVLEAYEAMPEPPTHVFIQAGVGALAGAVTGLLANVYKGKDKPIITVVEPEKADCIYKTAAAADGSLHFVTGDMDTMMAGLACGEPCDIGWRILESYADFAVACPDSVAARGMRMLGAPVPGDERIISGESGAVTSGLVAELMLNDKWTQIRRTLQLDEKSVVLCFSTEGATDVANYREVVWNGRVAGADD